MDVTSWGPAFSADYQCRRTSRRPIHDGVLYYLEVWPRWRGHHRSLWSIQTCVDGVIKALGKGEARYGRDAEQAADDALDRLISGATS